MLNSRRSMYSLLAASLLAGAAMAQQVTPLIFEREEIRITSPASITVITSNTPEKADTPKPEGDTPKEGASTDPKPPVATGHPQLNFDVEVRSEDALRLEYIHTLNSLADNTGVIISFTKPSQYNLPAFRVPTPVDVLFVMENGTVEQIVPNIVLSDLSQEITARKPFKGFLFLKAGTVAAKGIKPKDVVSSRVFNAGPALVR